MFFDYDFVYERKDEDLKTKKEYENFIQGTADFYGSAWCKHCEIWHHLFTAILEGQLRYAGRCPVTNRLIYSKVRWLNPHPVMWLI